MSPDSLDDDSTRLKQRIWGAVVLFAIAIIVLPLLLDGAGSESQFRRVERLREAPPTMQVNTAPVVSEMRSVDDTRSAAELIRDTEPDGSQSDAIRAERGVREALQQNQNAELRAWVVQAGSFRAESDAIALRDRLRQAGYASFVRDRDAPTELFHVLVGPMIKEARALDARKRIVGLLNTDAVVMSYP